MPLPKTGDYLGGPDWNTDVRLGSTEDLISKSQQGIREMIVREIPSTKNDGQAYKLNWPMKIEIERGEEFFHAVHRDLDLSSYGSTQEECLKNFYAIFEDMYQHYTQAQEDNLSGLAIRLKALFSRIVF